MKKLHIIALLLCICTCGWADTAVGKASLSGKVADDIDKMPLIGVSIYFPEHPMATNDGYILEHELIMSCVLGRHLEPDEVVHHKNHIRDDNRVCNLQVMTRAEHAALHMKERHEIQKRIKENNYEY